MPLPDESARKLVSPPKRVHLCRVNLLPEGTSSGPREAVRLDLFFLLSSSCADPRVAVRIKSTKTHIVRVVRVIIFSLDAKCQRSRAFFRPTDCSICSHQVRGHDR